MRVTDLKYNRSLTVVLEIFIYKCLYFCMNMISLIRVSLNVDVLKLDN